MIFHVGLAKAGSTYLQKFFESHPEIYYSGDRSGVHKFLCTNDLAWAPDAAREFIEDYVARARHRGLVAVYSHERLSGNPHSGHFDMGGICDRLYQVSPEMKVIVVLREQYSLIASVYKQYVRIGGTRSVDDFLEYSWDSRTPRFDWAAYCFEKLVGRYQSRFGASNVHVGLLEELVASPHRFLSELEVFLGVNEGGCRRGSVVNEGVAERELEKCRVSNLFDQPQVSFREPAFLLEAFPRWSRNLLKSYLIRRMGTVHHWPDGLRAHIVNKYAGRYGSSNVALARLIDRDLESLGYEVV